MFVVYYHNILRRRFDAFDRAAPRTRLADFERHLDWLGRHFEPLSFDAFFEAFHAQRDIPRGVLLTFDDGHAGIYHHAFPAMRERGWTGCVFVLDDSAPPLHFERLEIAFRLSRIRELETGEDISTPERAARAFRRTKKRLKRLPEPSRRAEQARIETLLGVTEADIRRHAADPAFAKLNPEQLAALRSAGWTVGGHSKTHRVLTQLDDAGLDDETAPPRACTGQPVIPFAYPYGETRACDARVAASVRRAGYACAFTTRPAPVESGGNPFFLPRMTLRELRTLSPAKPVPRVCCLKEGPWVTGGFRPPD